MGVDATAAAAARAAWEGARRRRSTSTAAARFTNHHHCHGWDSRSTTSLASPSSSLQPATQRAPATVLRHTSTAGVVPPRDARVRGPAPSGHPQLSCRHLRVRADKLMLEHPARWRWAAPRPKSCYNSFPAARFIRLRKREEKWLKLFLGSRCKFYD